jgi:beta-lactamase regulating signal transducer with metallopeptidase domain
MEPLTQSLVWCILQVTLVAALAWLLCWAMARWTASATVFIPATALAAIVVLTACAFTPWPSWWRYGPSWQIAESAPSVPADSRLRLPGGTSPDAGLSQADDAPADPPLPLADAATEVSSRLPMAELPVAASELAAEQSPLVQRSLLDQFTTWFPIALGALLAVGALLGLLQLAGGLLSVRSHRRRSQPLDSKDLAELVDCLRAELSLTRPVELRESDQLATAATVGWTRPVILLPRSWRTWSEDQRRAVLAHELAHVARGDYLACVLAQLSVALHFYHPLVHWLAARLRLEQELAADAAAAELAGGRRSYLQSLAELALHTTERPLGWPAHTFLPTQGTFLRRIEMLRDSKNLAALPARSWSPRWAAVGLLVLGAALIAGVRGRYDAGVAGSALAQAPATPAAEAAAKADIDLAHVSNDAQVLVAIRPAAALALPEIREALAGAASEDVPVVKMLTLPNLEQVTAFALPGVEFDEWLEDSIIVLQFSQPASFEAVVKTGVFPADATRIDGRLIAKATGPAYGVVDERTLALSHKSGMLARYLANRRRGSPLIAAGPSWEKVRAGALVAALDMELIRQELREKPPGTPGAAIEAQSASLAPLWTDSEYVVAGVIVEGKTVHVRAVATCHDATLAQNVADTAQAGATLARNTLRWVRERERDAPAFALLALDTADALLKSVKIERTEKLVVAQAQTDVPKAKAVAAAGLVGEISKAREAARKVVSSNNLKQIGIALHNWADQHEGRFPPPVIMGKDGKGKVPHSWRVALLPYLEAEELYRQYNFDEPWDSESNKKLIPQIHPIYRHPKDDPKSTSAGYFVLRPEKLLRISPAPGGGTMGPIGGFPTAFSEIDGMPFAHMTDGTSNTIAVVEAKRDIPWTKPEDILIDPAKELPALGGYFKDGFHAAWCDGSVRFLDSKLDPKILKIIIKPDDGEVVPSF